MAETQRTIAEWRRSVFGRADDPVHVVGRALEEFAELVECLGHNGEGLARRARRMQGKIRGCVHAPSTQVADEMADVLIVLLGAADEFGFDLWEAVERKMEINRARSWRVDGPGLGRHA